MSDAFLKTQLTKIETALNAYGDALIALAADPTLSYTLDTGQTRQIVTVVDVTDLQKSYDSLLNTYSTLDIRINGGSAGIVIPGKC